MSFGKWTRREIAVAAASLSGVFAAASSAAAAAGPEKKRLVWPLAESTLLWPGRPPGWEGFDRSAISPDDADSDWLMAVAAPSLGILRPSRPNGAALLICPGGAYETVGVASGLKIGDDFRNAGFTVFVLCYRLPGEGWLRREDVPLQDAQRAMRWIRANAARFGISPHRIGALGLSAGGHLSATLATDFDQHVYDPVDALDRQSARPDFAALVYPVISMAEHGHAESRDLLLGKNPDADRMRRRSPALRVRPDMPPVFLLHGMNDSVVPVQNSIDMLEALKAVGVPVETHLFPIGEHGFAGEHDVTTDAELRLARLWPELFSGWVLGLQDQATAEAR